MLLVVILLFSAAFARAEVCPENCHCYTEDGTGLRVANCTISALSTQRGPVDVEVVNFLPPRFHTITLGATTFKHFHSTKYLTLSNMKIRHVPEDAFQGMKKLIEIDLSFNKIKHVSGLAYKDLKDLKGLYLRGNPLQMILLDVIVSKSLKELDLGNCGLPDLPSGIFDQVPALNHLYLDGNLLTTLHFSLLPRGLTYLNLANNKIADVPVDVLMSLRSLQRIDLSENPINCTCSLLIMQDNFSGDGKVFENNPTCSSPPRYAGKRLSKLDENELCKREFMPDPSLNQIRHLKHAHIKYSMQGDQNLQSDQPAPDYDDYENDQISEPGDDGDNKLSGGKLDTDYDERSPTDDPQSSETLQGFTETDETESETTMNSKENNLGMSSDQNSLTTNSEETTQDIDEKHDVTAIDGSNHTEELGRLTTLMSNSSSEMEDYSYDATHPDYLEASTEPTLSSSSEDEFEGSGDDITTETSSTYKFLEEQENETVTENYSVENVTDVFNLEETSTTVTEESSTFVEVSSEPTTAASSTEQSSEPSSSTEPEPSSSSEPEPSSSTEQSSSTSFPLLISEEPTSHEPSSSSESTSHEPSSSSESSTESVTSPLPIIEPEIIKEFESDKENVINSKESFSKEEKKEEILEAYVIYMIITLLITIVIVLVLVAVCRRKKSKTMKVSLPADPESNLGTEMQDMLLPKPPENGIKVVPKSYTNGNTANGKTPEQKEEETPVLSEPERDWDEKLGPIEAVTARMSVLARPQTPVFIHKSIN